MAFMPTGYMLAVAKALDASAGTKPYDSANAALSLRELQYDGWTGWASTADVPSSIWWPTT
jgi:hypothetical protein